ncbi:MAG: adenine phosphoribosyltransferase [Rubripirellula sp.]
MIQLSQFIRDIPDYPKPGILFRDITPLLADHGAFEAAVDAMAEPFLNEQVDVIAAAEARGFIFGTPLALRLGAGFAPVRKPGKLPFEVHSHEYDLEYGTDELQIHTDAFQPGQRVLVVDDLLATGGTVQACCKLIESCGAEVIGCSFLIHLQFLNGHEKLDGYRLESVLEYE